MMTELEMSKAKQLQEECHALTPVIMDKLKKGTIREKYQAAKDVWIYNTLAGILVRLEKLEQKQ